MIWPKVRQSGWVLLGVGALVASMQAADQQKVEPGEGETLHVLVGKSVIINVQSPLTRVLSSNPEVIETMATSPSEVVVEGKAAGPSSVILWDSNGHTQVLDVMVDVDVTALRGAIQHAYPKDHIDIEADGGRLVLTGSANDPHTIEDLTKMAAVYSKEVVNSVKVPLTHDRQILLEVKFAEVDRTAISQFGFNLLSTGAGNTIGSTTTQQFGQFGATKINDVFGAGFPHFPFQIQDETVTNPLNFFLFRPDLHLGAIIQDLEQHNVLQILAEPNLMAINGQKATFLAGGEFPFPVVQPGTTFTTITILFKPFGVKLDFTGNVEEDGTVRLHVAPEVSTLDFSNALTLSGFVIPAISTRRAETEIELKDGQAFGIAGLLDHRATTQLSKTPGIGDIPILGQLFRSKNINKNNSELLVMVTPHIVDPVRLDTTPPATPGMSVPFLDQEKYDRQSPGHSEIDTKSQDAGAK
ncbi:MAG TPA: pilus assembly protein N-terminal domain-containing protein [Candidatus Sulfotelmatobacter sp.]|nr:pilus assembly protein N-terminal domain-containing protein [Candidatus Sulfotelmatobacter sp.]